MTRCKFNGDGGCPNEGTRYPIICLPPPLPHPHTAHARFAMALETCEACTGKVAIANFLLPQGKAQIVAGMQAAGKLAPDFDRAWLEWGTVGDEFWWDSLNALIASNSGEPN